MNGNFEMATFSFLARNDKRKIGIPNQESQQRSKWQLTQDQAI